VYQYQNKAVQIIKTYACSHQAVVLQAVF